MILFAALGRRGPIHVSDSPGVCEARFVVPKKRLWPRGKVFTRGVGEDSSKRGCGLDQSQEARQHQAHTPSRPGLQARRGFPGSRGRRAWPGAGLGVPRLGEEPGRRQWTQQREGRRLREQPGGGTRELAPRPLPPPGPLPLLVPSPSPPPAPDLIPDPRLLGPGSPPWEPERPAVLPPRPPAPGASRGKTGEWSGTEPG